MAIATAAPPAIQFRVIPPVARAAAAALLLDVVLLLEPVLAPLVAADCPALVLALPPVTDSPLADAAADVCVIRVEGAEVTTAGAGVIVTGIRTSENIVPETVSVIILAVLP